MIVNRSQIAEILGVTLPTVDQRVKEGMPFLSRPGIKKAKSWQFSPKDCINWLVERAQKGSKTDRMGAVNLRIAEADATMKEIRVAESQKRLIGSEKVVALMEEQLSVVKSRFKAVPGRLAQALSVETDPETVRRLLKDEISEALDEISTPEEAPHSPALPEPPAEDLTEEIEPSTEGEEDEDDSYGY
jgi:terminase small subunit / prophage DNA-packing protein